MKIELDYPRVTDVGELLRKQYKALVYMTKDRKWLVTESPDGSVVKRPHDEKTGKFGEPVVVKGPRRDR